MSTILTITANPLLDHLATVTWMPGKVVRTPRIAQVAGGKGVNVARVLARHGHQVTALGFAGGAEGRTLAGLVAQDGIIPSFTDIAARLRVGFQVIEPGSRSSAILEDGFAVTAAEAELLLGDLRRRLPVDLVIVSGSVPDPAIADLYRRICDLCAQAGVSCWVDAYGPAMNAALAGDHPPLLAKPNTDEYGDHSTPWLAVRELHLTAGAHTVVVRSPEGRYRVVPPAVVQVNPIGSGDCYLAALAHARLSGFEFPAQLAYAAAAGAANAARADVARIGPEDIRPLTGGVTVALAP